MSPNSGSEASALQQALDCVSLEIEAPTECRAPSRAPNKGFIVITFFFFWPLFFDFIYFQINLVFSNFSSQYWLGPFSFKFHLESMITQGLLVGLYRIDILAPHSPPVSLLLSTTVLVAPPNLTPLLPTHPPQLPYPAVVMFFIWDQLPISAAFEHLCPYNTFCKPHMISVPMLLDCTQLSDPSRNWKLHDFFFSHSQGVVPYFLIQAFVLETWITSMHWLL